MSGGVNLNEPGLARDAGLARCGAAGKGTFGCRGRDEARAGSASGSKLSVSGAHMPSATSSSTTARAERSSLRTGVMVADAEALALPGCGARAQAFAETVKSGRPASSQTAVRSHER